MTRELYNILYGIKCSMKCADFKIVKLIPTKIEYLIFRKWHQMAYIITLRLIKQKPDSRLFGLSEKFELRQKVAKIIISS